ncbi:hypothetical protein ABEF92_006004 [Exophiala dermatitidis]|uniref:Uncharacterized protein n=1 Tax=Exophiala dermatitidis (strain ATCC 34100 / CBS 525.76 / NIH/UT8656) TaxID=858893 RepID=H6BK66_EXODN|nr:uncharacterized protein HMPREF1120_00712 [Exophiala dermatitidis NIH/UT8656]EHY52500.1 hypothetical protein HMPREF1120_00712 [Exophiala dermatitidis NIH/UT8656]
MSSASDDGSSSEEFGPLESLHRNIARDSSSPPASELWPRSNQPTSGTENNPNREESRNTGGIFGEWTGLSSAEDIQFAGSRRREQATRISRVAPQDDQVQLSRQGGAEPEPPRNSTPGQLKELVQALNNNNEIQTHLQKIRHGPYSKVSVLPIMFEAVEPFHELDKELESVRTCFRDHFGYAVYPIFKIPRGKDSHDLVNKKISDLVKEHGKKGELVIVVYAGHGMRPSWNHFGPAVWADRSSANQTVNWSEIQPLLENAECDTLIILNCCYAGNAVLGPKRGTTEILAASDRDTQTGTLEKSFLRVVVEELVRLSVSAFNVETLHHHVDKHNTLRKGQRIRTPFYRRLPDPKVPSIWLQRLVVPDRTAQHPRSETHMQSNGSFYVKVSLDATENDLELEASWSAFLANASWPGVKDLTFYTEDMLLSELKN